MVSGRVSRKEHGIEKVHPNITPTKVGSLHIYEYVGINIAYELVSHPLTQPAQYF